MLSRWVNGSIGGGLMFGSACDVESLGTLLPRPD